MTPGSDAPAPAVPETPAAVRSILKSRGLRPRRRLGQNFLADQNIRDAIVASAGAGEGDLVLEVGPGLGMLTKGLLATGASVVAVELDRGLCGFLGEVFGGDPRLELIPGDVLDGHGLAQPVREALGRRRESAARLLLVANLPYSAATPLLAALARDQAPPERFVVMVQKEVALRMAGRPGTPDYGPLAVLLSLRGELRTLREVAGTVFVPRTSVRSSLVEYIPRPADLEDLRCGEWAAKLAFRHRRKVLRTSLRASLPGIRDLESTLEGAGIDSGLRPEVLSPEDFVTIGRVLMALRIRQ